MFTMVQETRIVALCGIPKHPVFQIMEEHVHGELTAQVAHLEMLFKRYTIQDVCSDLEINLKSFISILIVFLSLALP